MGSTPGTSISPAVEEDKAQHFMILKFCCLGFTGLGRCFLGVAGRTGVVATPACSPQKITYANGILQLKQKMKPENTALHNSRGKGAPVPGRTWPASIGFEPPMWTSEIGQPIASTSTPLSLPGSPLPGGRIARLSLLPGLLVDATFRHSCPESVRNLLKQVFA